MGQKFYDVVRKFVVKNADFKAFLGLFISIFLLWLTFHNSGLTISNVRLDREQVYYFTASIGVFIVSVWVSSIRAKLVWLDRTKNLEDVHTLSSLIVGGFYNCLLPGNLGEGMRAWHFSRKNKVPFSRSLAAILAEKWLDAQMFVLCAIVLYLLKPFISHFILYSIFLTASIVVILFIIYNLIRRSRVAEKKIWHLIFRFQKTGRFLYRLYSHTGAHLQGLKANEQIARYLLFCFVILFLNISQFFLLLKAAGVVAPVCSFYTAFLAALSMMIIAFVPSAPSNIGVIHYGLYSTLIIASRQYGLMPDSVNLQGFALFGVCVHLSYVVPDVLLGVIFVVKERRVVFYS